VRIRLASAAVLFVALCVPLGAAEPPGAIAWTDWSDTAFERARADGRLVLLDLGAVWCHWCHVMEETTYRDPEVVSLIRTRFVPVHVDQDARPDLSNRYEDYGWPATVVFDSAGQELVKFQGYIEPERMRGLLRAVIADPTPGPSVENATAPSVGEGAALTDAERRDLAASPNVTFVELPDAGHMIMTDQPGRTIELILEALPTVT
jgi:pimeloyl-ACP methyl ester carboxylesterase